MGCDDPGSCGPRIGGDGVPGRGRFSQRALCSVRLRRRLRCGTPKSPFASWSPDGKFFHLNFQGYIYAIPLRRDQMLPPIPVSGFRTKEEVAALRGVRLIAERAAYPGPNPSMYAFVKVTTHRNIYRVTVP